MVLELTAAVESGCANDTDPNIRELSEPRCETCPPVVSRILLVAEMQAKTWHGIYLEAGFVRCVARVMYLKLYIMSARRWIQRRVEDVLLATATATVSTDMDLVL
jgi:hypothetical protein